MTPEEMEEFKRTSRLMRIVSTARAMFIGVTATYDFTRMNRKSAQADIEQCMDLAERFEDHAEAWMESE